MKPLLRLWYRHSPQLFISELLEKRWMEPIVPFILMCVVFLIFIVSIPGYTSLIQLQQLMRSFPEQAFVAMAMALSILSGGIDLSVAAVFAMANFIALYLLQVLGLPFPVAVLGTLLWGACIGAVNGGLIAYGKTRPFLTTIVVLIIVRAAYNKLTAAFALELASGYADSPVWDFVGVGLIWGIPVNMACLVVIGIVAHLYLTRIRSGVHIMAVGSSRKAARHAGINVKRSLFTTYVLAGMLASFAGLLYAARLNSAGTDTGVGWEINALAAAVVGGISLDGGRGTISRALMGAAIIFLLINGLVQLGTHGSLTTATIGFILLAAVGFNIKFVKNKGKILQKIYVSPSYVEFTPPASIARDSGSVFAENDRLKDVEAVALDRIEGPEDVILDQDDHLYTVNRNGSIIRFLAPDYQEREEFARIGGRPLGLALDRDKNILACVAGMGVYGVRPDRTVFKVAEQTNRTWNRLKDDSRLWLADDLDVAPDGKIYFSDATTRYDLSDWALDGFEGRGNGRLVCHDPATGKSRTILKNLAFPNGVCISHDGMAVLWASTWLCRIYRYWIAGERTGELEILVDNLPGYPDNINRASDGNYWLAFVGLRAPVYDLAMADPAFRSRMVKQIPPDEWLCPGLNYGCVIKFDDAGSVLESLWDPGAESHPTITSMREHKGYLYIGGLENNRIGRLKLPAADKEWTGWESYWGKKRRDGRKDQTAAAGEGGTHVARS
ncbi:ABC transporter permease [Oceanibacterium hippocampi]|uniref:Ribose transport system permease protein RbsC n=1 Tax=Oceanibacterium hippocampi TaxID=745714 RepID=A0A1Y5TXW4_9PROT|nr:SMP-30/gluconolactonase/LRE family protein [Oceanibacterium hippocampi]SLN76533.1 Ribose transport system permease protein RbsC [Oceanibacterium hippocampi]